MKPKKIKPKGIKYWKRKAWQEFSKYIRLRDAWKTTHTTTDVICYTCGKLYPAFGKGCVQAGHIVQGRWNNILFHEHGVQAQCYHCNIHLGGNYVAFEEHFIQDYCEEELHIIKQLSKQTKYFTAPELEALYNYYKNKYKELEFKIDMQK